MNEHDKTVEDLASEYFFRELDKHELERLQEALKTDNQLRQSFSDSARDEWLLHHIHSDMDQQYVEKKQVETPTPKVVKFPKRQTFSPKWAAIAATVAVLCTIIALLLKDQARTRPQMASSDQAMPPLPEPAELQPVAKLRRMYTLPDDKILVTNNGETRTLDKKGILYNGDSVELPKNARIRFAYDGENTLVNLSNQSKFKLSDDGGAKHIHLEYGTLTAKVAKQPIGKPMRLTTNDAEAVVLGTSFELRAEDYTQLSVLTGQVGFNSLDAKEQLKVNAGYLAQSNHADDWAAHPFTLQSNQPTFDHTINKENYDQYIAVDSKRNYIGFLRFDCGELNGQAIETTLRLRVARHQSDYGGDGTVRLYKLPPTTHIDNALNSPHHEIASYTGKLGIGMDLDFEINPDLIQPGINTFIIKLDKGGNDFWFSSSEGPVPPELTLKLGAPPF